MNSKEINKDNDDKEEREILSSDEEIQQLKDQLKESNLISNNTKEYLLILEKELRRKEVDSKNEIRPLIEELRFLRTNKRQLESKIKFSGIETENIIRAKNRAEKENKFLSKKIEYLEEDIRKLRKENELMKSSTSWKVTKPLRKLTKLKK